MERMPETPNGKIDRKALPELDPSVRELDTAFVAPQTSAEKIVAGIFSQLLGQESVGIYDDFFKLGGHSLLAIQLVFRLREAFQMDLPIHSVFRAPTVNALIGEIAKFWGAREIVEEVAHVLIELEHFSEDEVAMMLSGEQT